jgi:hypothetical protein
MSLVYRKTRWIQEDYVKSYEVDNGTALADFSLYTERASAADMEAPDVNTVMLQLYDILDSCC